MMFEQLITAAIIITAVVIGYILGRQTSSRPINMPTIKPDQGSTYLDDTDPYAEALQPQDRPGKRIATL